MDCLRLNWLRGQLDRTAKHALGWTHEPSPALNPENKTGDDYQDTGKVGGRRPAVSDAANENFVIGV